MPKTMLTGYPKSMISYLSLFISFLLPFSVHSLNFSFTSFDPNDKTIIYSGSASAYKTYIILTSEANDVGRVIYSEPVRLWDSNKKQITSFKTEFSISIVQPQGFSSCCGVAFFLAPNGSNVPVNSDGPFLGLFSNDSSQSELVAVEFDNFIDPPIDGLTGPHVGIDTGSLRSVKTAPLKSSNIQALVNYDGVAKVLNVSLDGAPVLSYSYNFSILPEWINVGFSASTETPAQLHYVHTWSFSSDLETGTSDENGTNRTGTTAIRKKLFLLIGLPVILIIILISSVGLICHCNGWFRRTTRRRTFTINCNDWFSRRVQINYCCN